MSVATPSTVPITNYADFWPHYLREHSKPETRALHYAGTAVGTLMWLIGLCTGNYKLIPAGIFAGEQAEAPYQDLVVNFPICSKLWLNRRIFRCMGWTFFRRA